MLKLITNNLYSNLTFKSSENSFFLNKELKQLSLIALNIQTLKTGWAYFALGMAPVFVWDAEVGKPGSQPSEEYKRAFSIEVIDEEDGPMDWSGAGYGSCAALEQIFEEIGQEQKEHLDKLPVLRFMGSEAKKIGKGNTRIPQFELLGWCKPDALPWMQNNDDAFDDCAVNNGEAGAIINAENIPF